MTEGNSTRPLSDLAIRKAKVDSRRMPIELDGLRPVSFLPPKQVD